QTGDVLRLVIAEGMSPVLVGIAAGTVAALASARVMKTLVFGVSAADPLTLVAVAATLALVAFMASLVPVYHALRLDPVKVLRSEEAFSISPGDKKRRRHYQQTCRTVCRFSRRRVSSQNCLAAPTLFARNSKSA